MGLSFLWAVLGTVSTLFAILFMTTGRYVENPSMSLNGWAMLFGLGCYAIAGAQALGIARARWVAGADAVWPLAWSLAVFSLAGWLSAATLATILDPSAPGHYPWVPVLLGGVALLGFMSVGALVSIRVLMTIVRAGQQIAHH
jgi:hypothetical protein